MRANDEAARAAGVWARVNTPSRNAAPAPTIFSSVSNEWQTPALYVEPARRVLGRIDLDPASSPEANATVRAEHIYTADDDGLSKSWWGRVWLNPPYGRGRHRNDSNQARWAERMIEAFRTGEIEAGIMLLDHVPERRWWARLGLWDLPCCVTHDRIKFRLPGGVTGADRPIHVSALLYLGPHEKQFSRAYAKLGAIKLPGRPCPLCSAPMHGRADQLYCSSACKQRAWRVRGAA